MLTEFGGYLEMMDRGYGVFTIIDDFEILASFRNRQGDFAFYSFCESGVPRYALAAKDRRIVAVKNPNVVRLEGRVFGKLMVVGYCGQRDRKTLWLCSCECGGLHVVRSQSLLSGSLRSCGCMTGFKIDSASSAVEV